MIRSRKPDALCGLALALGVAVAACGRGTGASPSGTSQATPDQESGAERGKAPQSTHPVESSGSASVAGPPAAPSTAAVPVGIVARLEPTAAGEWTIAIENHGSEVVSVASSLAIEARDGATWRHVSELESLAVRRNCDEAVPSCRPLAPGAELNTSWNGRLTRPQCNCADCPPAPAGPYRVVVRACAGTGTTSVGR